MSERKNVVSRRTIPTSRLGVHARFAGDDEAGFPVILVHGNCSSSAFFERFMGQLPNGLSRRRAGHARLRGDRARRRSMRPAACATSATT